MKYIIYHAYEWEQRKLGEIFIYENSKHSLSDVINMNDGIYPIFDANKEVKKVDIFDQNNKYISIIKDGSGVGRTTLMPANSSVISTMGYVIPKDFSPYFGINLLKNINLKKYIVGSTIPHIYFNDYKNKKVFLPNDSLEQKYIGEVLNKIDFSIASNECNKKSGISTEIPDTIAYI